MGQEPIGEQLRAGRAAAWTRMREADLTALEEHLTRAVTRVRALRGSKAAE
jgi:hypothetical protein